MPIIDWEHTWVGLWDQVIYALGMRKHCMYVTWLIASVLLLLHELVWLREWSLLCYGTSNLMMWDLLIADQFDYGPWLFGNTWNQYVLWLTTSVLACDTIESVKTETNDQYGNDDFRILFAAMGFIC